MAEIEIFGIEEGAENPTISLKGLRKAYMIGLTESDLERLSNNQINALYTALKEIKNMIMEPDPDPLMKGGGACGVTHVGSVGLKHISKDAQKALVQNFLVDSQSGR